MKVIYYLRL